MLRTTLTMLGIIIGVGAVITMVSISNGAKAMVEAQIASLGQNVILVFSGSVSRGGIHTGWGSAGTLTIEDANRGEDLDADVVAVTGNVGQRVGRQVVHECGCVVPEERDVGNLLPSHNGGREILG